jgi:hypothetical protein
MRIRTAIRGLMLVAAIGGMLWAEQLARAQDVSLEVRTKDGRAEYRIGEPIALQMVFTSTNQQYVVDTSFRYPALQGSQDDFLINPKEGTSDPMEDYRRAISHLSKLGFGILRQKKG